MSYTTSISPPLPIIDGAFAETTHILQRVSIAGMVGLGAGPLVIGKSKKMIKKKNALVVRPRPPAWRMSILGSVGVASASLPFLCMERLAFYSIVGSSPSDNNNKSAESIRYALYASHALGTILGAGVLRGVHQAVKKTRQPNHFPIRVMAVMLCKAHVETILLKNEGVCH